MLPYVLVFINKLLFDERFQSFYRLGNRMWGASLEKRGILEKRDIVVSEIKNFG
jgi:hypothetical protein